MRSRKDQPQSKDPYQLGMATSLQGILTMLLLAAGVPVQARLWFEWGLFSLMADSRQLIARIALRSHCIFTTSRRTKDAVREGVTATPWPFFWLCISMEMLLKVTQIPMPTSRKRKAPDVWSYRSAWKAGRVVRADALMFLSNLPDDSADIVFLDPPFNLGKRYSHRRSGLDKLPEQEYSAWLNKILSEATRVLKQGAVLYMYHLPQWAMRLGNSLEGDLRFQHWIAISMKNGFVRGDRLYPAHYALLMFTNGRPTRLRRPKLRPAKCRHCDNLIKDYGGYRSIIEAKGINLSDFWEDLSPVRHANRKHRRANELPMRLFERIFGISGKKGDVYVDPFAGTGTGVIAAVRAGMRFEACDIVRENCNIIRRRLDEIRDPKEGM